LKINGKIFLPGTDRQISTLLKTVEIKDKSVLIIGSGSEEIGEIFYHSEAAEVYLITDDEDSLLQTRLILSGLKEINVRLMEFDNTDFKAEKFDIIYTQGSTWTKKRNKIIKEIKKILKPKGYLCIGEIISLSGSPPQFVKDIWENNDLSPLFKDEFKKYYLSKGFELILEEDLSGTLKDFYSISKKALEESSNEFTGKGSGNLRKLLKTYNHEAKAYLELGGDKFMGYEMLILRKV
jgi:SAM-dependent methyltransferase